MMKFINMVFLATIFVGCAKEKSYDKVNKIQDLEFKDQHLAKSKINKMCGDAKDPCLYMPSVANTPYKVAASRPYWQGNAKLVISKITEDKLQFLELDDRTEFTSNTNNLTPVFSLGLAHVDYKCVEDEFGDCTNKEEVDAEKNWERRKYVKLDLAQFQVQEINSLPIQFGELFQKGCFTSTGQDVQLFDVTENTMNLTVKVTYSASARCVQLKEWADLRYLVFNIDYKYSIAKLSSLTDSKYKKVEYPSVDENYFGFFTTDHKDHAVDHQDNVIGIRKTLMNRWSPNKKEVVYYMNSEFYTEEMKDIKEATLSAIETVNYSLAMANTNMKITVKKGNDNNIGDLRHNFLILVPEPQASGIIGYGPSVANPETGEIVSARTVMYFGSIQKFIGRAWDDIVDADTRRQEGLNTESVPTETDATGATSVSGVENFVEVDSKMAKLLKGENKFLKNLMRKSDIDSFDITDFQHSEFALAEILAEDQHALDALGINPTEKLLKESTELEKIYAKMAKETFFHGSYMNFDDAVASVIEGTSIQGRRYPYWSELSEEQRKGIMKQLLPQVWVPTLVHEFGHNLGLRHNFYGSVDKKNWYTEEESRQIGFGEQPVYSSIMDYAPRNANELKVMGKYDVAALRFGYAREVELTENRVLPIEDSYTVQGQNEEGEVVSQKLPGGTLKNIFNVPGLGEQVKPLIKPYMYCSDEHVGNDILCNRHDEGTTREEVVDYYISRYNDNYDKRNFRGRKYDMNSRYGDINYLNRVVSGMGNIRQFFDIYDAQAFSGSYDGDAWQSNPRLVDTKKASDKAFEFFMSTLEEPAYHCVEIDKETKNVTRVLPFSKMALGTQLEEFGITFDIRYGCLFLNHYGDKTKIYGEFGKYINNSLDLTVKRDEILRTDRSQIDVRGIWLDKVIASFFTSLRMTQPTTIGAAPAGNFLDYADYRERFENYMKGLTQNKLDKEVVVSFANGAKAKMKATVSFDDSYQINQSFNYGINYLMNFNQSRNSLKTAMMRWFKNSLAEDNDGDLNIDNSIYNEYHVQRLSTSVPVSHFAFDEFAQFYRKGTDQTEENVTYRFGIKSGNAKASELNKVLKVVQHLDRVDKEIVLKAYTYIVNEQTPDDTQIVIKELMEYGKEMLQDYLFERINQQSILSSLMALSETGKF